LAFDSSTFASDTACFDDAGDLAVVWVSASASRAARSPSAASACERPRSRLAPTEPLRRALLDVLRDFDLRAKHARLPRCPHRRSARDLAELHFVVDLFELVLDLLRLFAASFNVVTIVVFCSAVTAACSRTSAAQRRSPARYRHAFDLRRRVVDLV